MKSSKSQAAKMVGPSGRTIDADEIGRAMNRAIRAAMRQHALLGQKVAFMRDGKIVSEVPPLPKKKKRTRAGRTR